MESNPLWYKDAIIYQLHVRAYRDSDGDGIGDFRGLMDRLDYLQDLGVTAIWLLPFYPSPLKDDGYDIADYTDVQPAYGTLADFKLFLREAHRRDLRVITELVLNHTSDRHAWFQRARRAKAGSKHRNFYVWSDTAERYTDARIIFKDFETSNWAWDPELHQYYWHRFYSHQPDLNFDNPAVREELFKVVDFWLEMGVDGLRLDAVPYLYEREGTNCENLAETHEFLKHLRRHVDGRFPNRMLLAEANQWPEDAIAYFGAGDECHTAFHFPVMPRLFMSLQMEDRFPIIDILQQTPAIPDVCQWFLFLRNHDELTLEMVTDEERDYMYRVYAHDQQARINLGIRRRLAPLLGNNRRKIELLNGLLLSLPGTPVIYYGDEIGMGDNIYLGDRNGVRTPMQWSIDRNAGFSPANAQRLYLPVIIDPEYHYEALNVETQQNNPHSLLWWMKRLIALRQRHRAFGRGTFDFLLPENRKVLAFVRRYEDEAILVVVNLSRFTQYVELDLSPHRGAVPVELFGRAEFPVVGEGLYPLSLGPHAFVWFMLEMRTAPEAVAAAQAGPPIIKLNAPFAWETLLRGRPRSGFESVLREAIKNKRWFGGKARKITGLGITEVIPVEDATAFALLQIDYVEGEPEIYVVPLGIATGADAERRVADAATTVYAAFQGPAGGETILLYDAFGDETFANELLEMVAAKRKLKGRRGELVGHRTKAYPKLRGDADVPAKPTVLKAEQSNSSVAYGDKLMLKLFRKIDEGENPDLEIGRFLTLKAGYPHVPPVAGSLEYRSNSSTYTLSLLQGFVANEGDAWSYTLDHLSRYFENVLAQTAGSAVVADWTPSEPLLQITEREAPEPVRSMIGAYLQDAELLGQRTAELHLALATERDDKAFAPEPFTQLFQRSFYQVNRTLLAQTFQLLRRRVRHLPETVAGDAKQVLELEPQIMERFKAFTKRKLGGARIRCHGDYHLGQVLFTGKDFVIIDFEGEPARPLSERRIKRSPLRDVAGMLRSFDYACHSALEKLRQGGIGGERLSLEWARMWYLWVSATFLKSYLRFAGSAAFLPKNRDEVQLLLDAYLLEKAVYELNYELNNRPDWVSIPLFAVRELALQGAPAT